MIIDRFEEILANTKRTTYAPGFLDRIAVALDLLRFGSARVRRTVMVPVYVTDLGVRRFTDPSVFFGENMRLGGQTPPPQEECVRLLAEADLSRLAQYLDAFILTVGDYDLCHEIILARSAELLAEGSAEVCINAGVITAGCSDPISLRLFDRAASESRSFPARFMAIHRAAAAEMKRFGRPEAGLRRLDELSTEIDEYRRSAPHEADVLDGVVKNLAALALVMLGDASASAREEEAANALLSAPGDLTALDASERGRYLTQVQINQSQLEYLGENVDSALRIARDNVNLCRVEAPEYVSESLTVAAYVAYRAGDLAEARAYVGEALPRLRCEASPTRLAAARKVLVGCYAKAGEPERAERLADLVASDPLGFVADE